MIRQSAIRETAEDETSSCMAVLAFVYDHGTRALAQRLTRLSHEHHEMIVASMHVHLHHESCLEVFMLKGGNGAVRGLTDELTAQRGMPTCRLYRSTLRVSGTITVQERLVTLTFTPEVRAP